jgi:hypothetical protein
MSMAWAKGNCFIQAGWRKNSRRLVTRAERPSERTSTTFHWLFVVRKPWIGIAPRTLPSSMSKG